MITRRDAVLTATLGTLLATTHRAAAQPTRTAHPAARNVVLVHGAFADGSSWAGVVAALQAAGMRVIAVQNPLTSLADDVAATRRALAMMDGPTVLAGHSYGGTVITEAGDDPKVAALVYVAALAPEVGEVFEDVAERYPASPGNAHIHATGGYARMDEAGYMANFVQDVPAAKARVLAASQVPVAAGLFGQPTTKAAWKSKPNWYAVSTLDRMVSTEMERFYAQRARAATVDVRASHLSPVSQPAEIAKLIQAAARGGLPDIKR